MLSDSILRLIRTWVPVGVGAALTWLAATLHIVIDPSSQAGLVALCAGVLTGAYYALVRLLEQRFPWLSVLLGDPTGARGVVECTDPAVAAAVLAPDPASTVQVKL